MYIVLLFHTYNRSKIQKVFIHKIILLRYFINELTFVIYIIFNFKKNSMKIRAAIRTHYFQVFFVYNCININNIDNI